jgi:serine protease Do
MYDRVTAGGWGFGGGRSSEQQVGAATGIVWSKDGYIITNAHVVFNEDAGQVYGRIKVTLYNEEEYDAEVVGYDRKTDLAVIKVQADNLQPAEFGQSTQLRLGQRVVVLGNNASYGWSVTQGVISGLARDVYEETAYAIKCLQTDAVINFGNSGGPLINTSGQVVGINSAKIVQTGYEGLGFSIPIEEARPILENLITNGYVKGRVMLGITGNTVTTSGYEGFRIQEISPDSPMADTNARAGDIITHVNDVRVKSYVELSTELNKNKVGDKVKITLMRVLDGGATEPVNVTVTLMEAR